MTKQEAAEKLKTDKKLLEKRGWIFKMFSDGSWGAEHNQKFVFGDLLSVIQTILKTYNNL